MFGGRTYYPLSKCQRLKFQNLNTNIFSSLRHLHYKLSIISN